MKQLGKHVDGPWALVTGAPTGTGDDLDIGLVLSNAGARNAPGWQRHASEPLAEVLVNDKQEIR
jgi:hypothetical protein